MVSSQEGREVLAEALRAAAAALEGKRGDGQQDGQGATEQGGESASSGASPLSIVPTPLGMAAAAVGVVGDIMTAAAGGGDQSKDDNSKGGGKRRSSRKKSASVGGESGNDLA